MKKLVLFIIMIFFFTECESILQKELGIGNNIINTEV